MKLEYFTGLHGLFSVQLPELSSQLNNGNVNDSVSDSTG